MDRRKLRARVRPDASWYRITNLAGDGGEPADVVIYDEIGYWGVSASAFVDELKGITAARINLRVNSPGGEIFDGVAIYNTLRAHAAHVTVYVDSLAASIASVIAMAGDRIVMQPHSQLMIHDGSGLCLGNAADMREMADLLDRQSDNIAAIYAERAGGTVRQWRERMRTETWYSDKEAVAAGLADEVAKMERQGEPEPVPTAQWDLSVFEYAGRAVAPAPDLGEPTETTPMNREPAAATAIPVVEPAPEPTPELVAAAWDPGSLKAALDAALEQPFTFDPDSFRGALLALTAEAAAVTATSSGESDDHADAEDAALCDDCGELLDDDHECTEPEPAAVLAETLETLAAEAPAVPTPVEEEPLPEPPPPPPPSPPDEPATVTDLWREFAEVMASGISLAANQSPAPPQRESVPTDNGADAVDGWAIHKAIKEAAR